MKRTLIFPIIPTLFIFLLQASALTAEPEQSTHWDTIDPITIARHDLVGLPLDRYLKNGIFRNLEFSSHENLPGL